MGVTGHSARSTSEPCGEVGVVFSTSLGCRGHSKAILAASMSNARCRGHFVASRVFIDEPIEFEVFQVGARLPQTQSGSCLKR